MERNLSRLLLVLFLFFLLFFSFFVVLFVLFFSLGDSISEGKKFDILMEKFNPLSNRTFTSHIETSRNLLGTSEYKLFRTEVGEIVVLSKFDDAEEYECSGYCVCEDEERRILGGVSAVHKGLMLLVSAVSTIMAVNVALEYFKNVCLTKVNDGCWDERFINDDIIKCSKKLPTIEELGFGYYTYFCTGFCLENRKLRVDKLIQDSKDFNCGKYDTFQTIEAPLLANMDVNPPSNVAKSIFRNLYMKPYCEKVSKITHMFMDKRYKRWRDVTLCVGSSKGIKNIKCKRIGTYVYGKDESPWDKDQDLYFNEDKEGKRPELPGYNGVRDNDDDYGPAGGCCQD